MIFLWGSLWPWPLNGASVRAPFGDQTNQQNSVTITAEELVGDQSENSAEFIGRVKVVRGEMTLTSDRLKLFFDPVDTPTHPTNHPRSAIKEVIADGRVHIVSNEFSASADRAIYDRESRTILLTGENAVVNHSGNAISGREITFFIDTEKITVSGNSKNRVKGVFIVPQKN